MTELFVHVAEGSTDPTWITTRSGELTWFNEATAALWEALDYPPPALGTLLAHAPSSGDEWRPEGAERVFRVRQLQDDGHLAWCLREETELRQAQRELAAARKQVERADAARSEFLGQIGHELRTPLNAIVGLTAGDDGLSQKVNRNARSLLILLSDLLDFAKLDAGLFVLVPQLCDPSGVVREGVEFHRAAAHQRGLGLTMVVEDTAPALAFLDAERLRQIIVNLVSNAVRFTLVGEIRVTLRGLESPTLLEITVEDTGLGMSRREQKLIFTRFYRAQRSLSERSPGTGLGLAICKALIEQMQGSIAVRSAPGKGSVFRVRIPVETVTPEVVGPQLTRPLNVLVVDDVDDNLRVTERILSELGDQATLVSSGHEALDAIAGGTFDVVLMDVDMHPMDGVRATVEIREREALLGTRRVPVIALTAHDLPTVRARCEACGMDGFVTKPVEPSALAHALDTVVDRALRILIAHQPNDEREVLADRLVEMGAVVLGAENAAEMSARLDGYGVDVLLVGALDATPAEVQHATVALGYTGRIVALPEHPSLQAWEQLVSDDLASLQQAPETAGRVFDPDIADLIPQYLDDRRADLDALRGWVEAGDAEAVARRAHQIKGSGTSYGFPELTELAGELERLAQAGELAGARPLIASMAAVVG